MMYLEAPPRLIETRIFSAMPDSFRRKGVANEWADRMAESKSELEDRGATFRLLGWCL